MSLFYLESSLLPYLVLASGPAFFYLVRPLVRSSLLGCLGPPFIGKGGALGQPKGSGGLYGGKKPLPERVGETWQLLLHVGPCAVAIILLERWR